MPEEIFHEIFQLAHDSIHAHRWQASDVLLLDNKRVLHGRIGPRKSQLVSRFGVHRLAGDRT